MNTFLDRRRERRSPPVLRSPAQIAADQVRLDVTILNVSRSGVMIALPEDIALPDRISLIVGTMLQPCEVVWRDGTSAGLRFD
ncbi:PilZ domain-containing protein [Devosia sp. SD17-2]|uniref:PilZ domain-containing protein n=1 Tax=Devosia sp. SD17-2 TaxID=2976459 RepID=UPI0023D7FB2E|nr:PilZ domain-containing protein [Devosia sp. SD17-2]WEJ33822.1 PilZ domain-containing protein [Devosia sp. SD17-2]